jgi:hypothetical protein
MTHSRFSARDRWLLVFLLLLVAVSCLAGAFRRSIFARPFPRFSVSRAPAILLGTLVGLSSLSVVSSAKAEGQASVPEEDASEPFEPEFTDSVNLSAFLALGAVIVNYEHLFAQRHGVVVEGYYSNFFNKTQSWTGGLAYRFHFARRMGGFFAGPFVRVGELKEEIYFDRNGKRTAHQVESTLVLVGANLGYRFQWDGGFNIVLRGGYGAQLVSDYQWSPLPQNNTDQKVHEALNGLDLEASIGFSF